jgi:hypothetical protein
LGCKIKIEKTRYSYKDNKNNNGKYTGSHIFEACEKSKNDYTESIFFTSRKPIMMISPINTYIASIQSNNSTTPIMMDELSIFLVLSWVTGQHLLSYEELIEANITNIFVYDIPEDKKEFNIETVRSCIVDIELKPYEWKNIYILRHFSTATLQAQNALLKILEECPIYAAIILEVDNPNSVLETIRSRVIDLTLSRNWELMNPIGSEIVEYYKNKNYKKLAQAIYNLKCTSNEAIAILYSVYPYLNENEMIKCNIAIESLNTTHENPRWILDVFFIH